MSAPAAEVIAVEATVPDEGRARRRSGPVFWLAVTWMVLVLLAAVLAGVLRLQDPKAQLAGQPLSGPSLHHPFGTDTIGYDLFSRVIYGARISMLVAVVSLVAGLVFGGGLGIVAGYLRGRTDALIMWVTDVLLTFPGLVLALALVSFAGRKLSSVLVAIAIISVPAYVRIARASSLVVSRQDFVQAARVVGATSRRIMLREVAPNVYIGMFAYAALGASVAIIAEGALAFLGLSVPDSLSWGSLIADGQSQLRDAPQAALAPAAVMLLTILSLNLIGERLGAIIDPRSSQL